MSRAMIAMRDWIEARFPLLEMWNEHLAKYYAPKNLNFWYYFGSLALLVLIMQIVTGIFLTMNYTPNSKMAFDSVEYIMHDVRWGWLIRYLHSVGASAFFIIVYLHLFRGLLYGSYKRPRELIWLVGMVILVLLMAEAFMGYLLPWGQMSYWGAEVITSLFGAIPGVGNALEIWLRGDFNVSNATLNRFFAWHVVTIPILLLVLVVVHLLALHRVGSNNPDGVEIHEKTDDKGVPLDGVPFHPYYTVKDLVGVGVFLLIFCGVVFFIPSLDGWFLEPDNFVPADPLKTPLEIKPLWYFMAMAGSILVFFALPWIDRNRIKSHRYRGGLYQLSLGLFALSVLVLGYLGSQPPTPVHADMGFRFTELYFSFFVLAAIYSRERSRGYFLVTLAAIAIGLFVLDWLRVGDIPVSVMLRSVWIPALYWLLFLLLPAFTRLNSPTSVPERVGSS